MVLGLPLLVCPCCGCQNTSVDAFSSLCLTHAQLLSFLFPCSCKKALGGDRTDLYLRRWSLKTFGAIRSILAKAPSVCFSVFLVRVHCCQEESNLKFPTQISKFCPTCCRPFRLDLFSFSCLSCHIKLFSYIVRVWTLYLSKDGGGQTVLAFLMLRAFLHRY